MVWRQGEGKTYSEVPAQALLGEMSYWDDIPPKGSKNELGPLGACHKGQEERESTHTVAQQVNKQNSLLCIVSRPAQVSGGG